MRWNPNKILQNPTPVVIFLACLWGVGLRFYDIATNNFFFYDEGLYLNLHRKYLELIARYPPKDFSNFLGALHLCFRLALGEGKALWFFISHLRVFWGGLEQWYFPRVISAAAGSLTVFFIFLWARRLLNSRWAAGLSVCLLAVLPSHVFYSRLALQEGFCTLLFLIGFYLYLFPSKFGYRTFLSAIFLVLAFFCNYRLIIIPVFVLFSEVFTSLASGRRPSLRKYLWHTVIFLFLVFLIGSLDEGQNTHNTFAWMFYQTHLAENQMDIFNFISYPYYIFRFEGILFGSLFFGNIYFLFKREWQRLFPFFMVCLAMAIFSFTADKGARYLCVMLPFAVLAVASLIEYLSEHSKSALSKRVLALYVALMVVFMTVQSIQIAQFKSDHERSIKYLKAIDPDFTVISTQRNIHNFFMKQDSVVECPKDFGLLLRAYAAGARYLIIGPQAYVSWAEDGNKFNPNLIRCLDIIATHTRPIKIFPHFSDAMLERFVFEHNDNFMRSLVFLRKSRQEHFGALKIYDLKTSFAMIGRAIEVRDAAQNVQKKKSPW